MLEQFKDSEIIRQGISLATGLGGDHVLPRFEDVRPMGEDEEFVVVNTSAWEPRGVPSIIATHHGLEDVTKEVITHFEVVFMLDFLRGNPLERMNQVNAWMRTEAAQKHFGPHNMTFIRTGATIDLTSLEAHAFTPRFQMELIFDVAVQTAAHEVPTATEVPVGGDKEFTVQL